MYSRRTILNEKAVLKTCYFEEPQQTLCDSQ